MSDTSNRIASLACDEYNWYLVWYEISMLETIFSIQPLGENPSSWGPNVVDQPGLLYNAGAKFSQQKESIATTNMNDYSWVEPEYLRIFSYISKRLLWGMPHSRWDHLQIGWSRQSPLANEYATSLKDVIFLCMTISSRSWEYDSCLLLSRKKY